MLCDVLPLIKSLNIQIVSRNNEVFLGFVPFLLLFFVNFISGLYVLRFCCPIALSLCSLSDGELFMELFEINIDTSNACSSLAYLSWYSWNYALISEILS